MRALVTGACGFVGGYLVSELLKNGHTVFGTTYSDSHQCECDTSVLDVGSKEACIEVLDSFKPDTIYHLAGISFVPEATKHFNKALDVNVHGVYNVLHAAATLKQVPKFVLASSGEVYGKVLQSDLPLTEFSTISPANAYSLSKTMAEDVARFYMRMHGVDCYIMRPFNHIGPKQNESFVTASFASQIAKIALKKSPPVIRVGNLDAVRDFMDVRDVVRAYQSVQGARPGTYNLSSGTSIAIQSILDLLIDISKVELTIEKDPERMRPSEVPEIRGSFDKAYHAFQWKPEIDIETSLGDIYKYWYDYHNH